MTRKKLLDKIIKLSLYYKTRVLVLYLKKKPLYKIQFIDIGKEGESFFYLHIYDYPRSLIYIRRQSLTDITFFFLDKNLTNFDCRIRKRTGRDGNKTRIV